MFFKWRLVKYLALLVIVVIVLLADCKQIPRPKVERPGSLYWLDVSVSKCVSNWLDVSLSKCVSNWDSIGGVSQHMSLGSSSMCLASVSKALAASSHIQKTLYGRASSC